MNFKNEILRLHERAKKLKLREQVKFFNSDKEYKQAYNNDEIKDYHICLIDDIQDDEEMIKKGYIKVHR